MNKLTVAMAERLKIPADVLDKPEEEIQSVIESLSDVHVFTTDELNTLKRNQMDVAIEVLSDPINKLPQPIYKRVQGTVLETTEGRLKKKFGYSGEYTGIDDLVEKIVKTSATDTEISAKYENLRSEFKKLEAEKDNAVTEAKKEVDSYIISDNLYKAVSKLPLKVPDDAIDEVREVVINNFLMKNDLKRENGKIIVSKKNGEKYVDRTLEPLELTEVLKQNLPKFVELKDVSGGRGDTIKPADGKVNNYDDFHRLCEEKKIKPNSREGIALLVEIKKNNPNFK